MRIAHPYLGASPGMLIAAADPTPVAASTESAKPKTLEESISAMNQWFRCDSASWIGGNSLARGACYIRNTLVVGVGIAATVAAVWLLGQIGKR